MVLVPEGSDASLLEARRPLERLLFPGDRVRLIREAEAGSAGANKPLYRA